MFAQSAKLPFFLLLAFAVCAAENVTTSPAPTANSTVSPAPTASFSPTAPTISPVPTTNSSIPPTISPAPSTSVVPTPSNSSDPPSPSPSDPPTPAFSPAPSKHYHPPTDAPTSAPHPHHHHKEKPSLLRILVKTFVWLIIIALSVLLFGAIMSNRYRIYYYIRSSWYSFLRMEGTQWVIRKLRLERFFGGQESSLNEIIFDSNLGEGLLMQ